LAANRRPNHTLIRTQNCNLLGNGPLYSRTSICLASSTSLLVTSGLRTIHFLFCKKPLYSVYTVLCLNILPASYILLVYKPDSKTKRNFRVSRPVNVFVHVFTFINSTYFSFSHADKHPVILNISLASDVWIFFTRESSVLYWLSREHLLSEKCRSIIQALNPDTKVIFSILLQFTQNNCSPVIGISTSISIERK
jgi:hypothetical protein